MTVFIASFGCAYLLPINQVFKSIATTPAIAALVAVIYQILKDQAAFERQDYLQRQQQIFNLGATSHMAVHNCIDTEDQIPPFLPLQRGEIPLFGKEGLGEIFR